VTAGPDHCGQRPVPRSPDRLELIALPGLPRIQAGDDLALAIAHACDRAGPAFAPGRDSVFVVAQKIVSKSEGRLVRLDDVRPGASAHELARQCGKDPRVVELILTESSQVVRVAPGVLIVEHRLGFVMANAGIDQSNVPAGHALLLPADPDASAAAVRDALASHFGNAPAVIVSDSVGRAWRNGTTGLALGVAGMASLIDLRGCGDLYGRPLQASETAVADNLAAAAALIMGEAADGKPVVLATGYAGITALSQTGAALLRAPEQDLFR